VSFGTCRWNGNALTLGEAEPKPRLSQEEPNLFLLLESFYYRVPTDDPDEGRVYVVAGADAPPQLDPREWDQDEETIVVPPNSGGRTDLASVPWVASWLVANYGSHTLAVLLHDALVPTRTRRRWWRELRRTGCCSRRCGSRDRRRAPFAIG
jgi:hypothetical protein